MMSFDNFVNANSDETASKSGIVDDFMYGSNVASSHVYIRLGFLRKVYGILSSQLLCTTLIGLLFVAVEPIRLFAQNNQWLFLIFGFSSIGLIIALMIHRKVYPTNYYLLGAFTLCESFLVGSI
ncbi:hypothetical protein HELRODRAFT_105150, partial [Helobdella robusta]|uniref:Uncharacterized protein n=1 Tax=Helobdella robusta TaxID=6412 RepID=T1EDR5_HELRO